MLYFLSFSTFDWPEGHTYINIFVSRVWSRCNSTILLQSAEIVFDIFIYIRRSCKQSNKDNNQIVFIFFNVNKLSICCHFLCKTISQQYLGIAKYIITNSNKLFRSVNLSLTKKNLRQNMLVGLKYVL
jgi:hypothetical protein